jgi:hypothetical protein
MSDAEAGIARIQTAASKGEKLKASHDRSVGYLNERIAVMLSVMSITGLILLWVTATSPVILYGSLAGIIILIFVIGLLQIRRLDRMRQERAQQAENWKSDIS